MIGFGKNKKKPHITAIIAAGGSSARMNGENKLLMMIGDKPVMAHSLLAFQNCSEIDEIIVSAHRDRVDEYAALAVRYGIDKLSKVVIGGESRLHSVYNAVVQVSEQTNYILVHDAARPLVSDGDIKAVIADTLKYNCAAASNKVTDTVKRVSNGLAYETVDRTDLYTVQTPQGADRALLAAALKKAIDVKDDTVTDECSALEKLGMKPYMSKCSTGNIKVTYPEDIFVANAIYDRRIKQCE